MMALITGELVHRGDGYVIIRAGELGYRVLMPLEASAPLEGVVTLYLHEAVREDRRDLFGFSDIASLELFWRLIAISGVGPKIAQKILCATPSSAELRARIGAGDLSLLTSVSGVGKKIAQKIILELSGELAEEESQPSTVDKDALSALVSLGYQRADAEAALAQVDAETTEERVRLALRATAKL